MVKNYTVTQPGVIVLAIGALLVGFLTGLGADRLALWAFAAERVPVVPLSMRAEYHRGAFDVCFMIDTRAQGATVAQAIVNCNGMVAQIWASQWYDVASGGYAFQQGREIRRQGQGER